MISFCHERKERTEDEADGNGRGDQDELGDGFGDEQMTHGPQEEHDEEDVQEGAAEQEAAEAGAHRSTWLYNGRRAVV